MNSLLFPINTASSNLLQISTTDNYMQISPLRCSSITLENILFLLLFSGSKSSKAIFLKTILTDYT